VLLARATQLAAHLAMRRHRYQERWTGGDEAEHDRRPQKARRFAVSVPQPNSSAFQLNVVAMSA